MEITGGDIKTCLHGLAELFLPRCCPVCGEKLLANEEFLCTSCRLSFPYTYFWTSRFNPMAERFNAALSDAGGLPEPYAGAVALYFYKGDYKKLSQALKYGADMRLGRYLAAALGRKVADCGFFDDVDVVIPVPLHWRRRFSRGYNQAEVIAEAVFSEIMGRRQSAGSCRLDTVCLKRRRHTGSQTKLDRSGKFANVKGAFSVKAGSLPEDGAPVHILLVDDVFTTGATLCECHQTLRRALIAEYGQERGLKTEISVATLAFVGE